MSFDDASATPDYTRNERILLDPCKNSNLKILMLFERNIIRPQSFAHHHHRLQVSLVHTYAPQKTC